MTRRAAICLIVAAATLAASSQVAHAAPPANDDSSNPVIVNTVPFVDVLSTQGATLEGDEIQLCPGVTIGATVWYRWEPPINMAVTADTFGSNFDTVITVIEDTGAGFPMITCNNDAIVGYAIRARESQVQFSGISGHVYYFEVGGRNGQAGKLKFSVNKTVPNDNVLDAKPIIAPHLEVTQNITATLETNEVPFCSGETGTLWYKYTVPIAGTHIFETTGSNFDTMVSVFQWIDAPGDIGGNLKGPAAFNAITCADDISASNRTSRATFNAVPGQTFFFEVGGKNGAHGILKISLSVIDLPSVPQALPATQVPWPNPIDNPLPPVPPEELPPIPPIGPIPPIPIPPIPPIPIPPIPPVPGIGPPDNDDLADATEFPFAPYATAQSTLSSTTQPGEPLNSCSATMSDTVWFKYRPTTAQSLFIDTLGTSFQTHVAVYVQNGNSFGSLSLVGCSGMGITGASTFAWQASANTTYVVQVGGLASQPVRSGVLQVRLLRLI